MAEGLLWHPWHPRHPQNPRERHPCFIYFECVSWSYKRLWSVIKSQYFWNEYFNPMKRICIRFFRKPVLKICKFFLLSKDYVGLVSKYLFYQNILKLTSCRLHMYYSIQFTKNLIYAWLWAVWYNLELEIHKIRYLQNDAKYYSCTYSRVPNTR